MSWKLGRNKLLSHLIRDRPIHVFSWSVAFEDLPTGTHTSLFWLAASGGRKGQWGIRILAKVGRDFPGDPVTKTLPSNVGGAGLIPGRGSLRSHRPENPNIKQKQYCDKRKDFLKKWWATFDFFFFFFLFPCTTAAYGISITWPGIKPRPLTLTAQESREFPAFIFWFGEVIFSSCSCMKWGLMYECTLYTFSYGCTVISVCVRVYIYVYIWIHVYICMHMSVYWLHLEAFSILVPQLGLKLMPFAVKVQCLNR